jgi:hypothetical protein
MLAPEDGTDPDERAGGLIRGSVSGRPAMHVPLTVNDFLYRAEAVSAYAAAVVDEPVQPAAPVRTTTYAELLIRVRG